jgi:hypothetical protein
MATLPPSADRQALALAGRGRSQAARVPAAGSRRTKPPRRPWPVGREERMFAKTTIYEFGYFGVAESPLFWP